MQNGRRVDELSTSRSRVRLGSAHLGDGRGHEEAGGENTDYWSDGQHRLHRLREEFVSRHAHHDGGEDHLTVQQRVKARD